MTISFKDVATQIRANASNLNALADQLDPLAASPAPSVGGPVGVSGYSKLAFFDDFMGSALDLSRWRQGAIWAAAGGHHGYNTTEKGWYSPDQVSLRDGAAVLRAEKKTGGENLPYSTGTITTAPDKFGVVKKDWKAAPATFEFTYGVAEARIKLPKGKGLWPAFWLLRSDEVWPPEIDVLEVVDPTGKHVAQHYHYGPQGKDTDFTKAQGQGLAVDFDISADFHVYAIEWTADRIRWFIDGKLTQEFTDKANIPNKPMYLLINLALSGSGWAGTVDDTTPLPAEMLVDYVKVWQR